MAYATVEDVEVRFIRTLDVDETDFVTARLDDVELIIKSRIPDLDQKVTDGVLSAGLVAMVEADVVIRLLRNPEAVVGETDGNYSYQLNWSTVTGRLTIMPDEWRLLGLRQTVFTIAPRMPDILTGLYAPPDATL